MVIDAVPIGAATALDVGTGDGLLAADLRVVIGDVTAVDIDAEVLARAAAEYAGITWICGDVMSVKWDRTFDVVASVATLHHLPDLSAALTRLADLTTAGGVLVVIGLARATSVRDHLMGFVGAVQHQWYSRTRTAWAHTAPTVWPPPHSYSEVRKTAQAILPGARWQRFGMWRYALTWNKPA